jgi:hypothetical protein
MNVLRDHALQCDVLVAGGGLAGVAAALAAARSGARVILCHDRPVLGGNASSEIRMHAVGADASGKRGVPLATEAREGGIIEEIRLDACVQNPQRSASMFDLILYDKCRSEPNLTLLLNTAVTGARVAGRRVTHAIAERQGTEERFTIEGRVFVDCTGDGRLGVETGAPFREGREDREAFGESLAVEKADQRRLGSSILFMARKHDRPMPFTPPTWARRFTETDLRLRPHAAISYDLGLEYGYWWIEWGGELDTIRDNERIRDELLAIVMGVWDHIKNGGPHGADCWALEWFGFVPGKRESRRFVGQYTLTEQDVLESRPMDDAIAYGGWPIDTHPPGGVDATGEPPATQTPVPWLYDIPLRACVGATLENLMFAGRNISATHVAFASTRVMATCAAVGQGVGTVAAYAVHHDLVPAEIPAQPAAVQAIQQQLLRDDAFLIGRRSNDPNDLARWAHITASSEQQEGKAENVVSGQTRSVHGPGGAAPGRSEPATHRWMSDPNVPLPAWIELAWAEPVAPTSVQLIFDTGLHRVLTFSHADDYVRRMFWGVPQPETVRDYTIEGRSSGRWQRLVEVRGNYQRRRVHPLSGRLIEALRVTVTATQGLEHARICEIRVLGGRKATKELYS